MRYPQLLPVVLLAIPASVAAHAGAHNSADLLTTLWHLLVEHAPMALLTIFIAALVYAFLRIDNAKRGDSA